VDHCIWAKILGFLALMDFSCDIAKVTADAVWNTSTARNIRDCVRVAKMAKSVEDVNWLVKSFL
jgi:hypothetical protein